MESAWELPKGGNSLSNVPLETKQLFLQIQNVKIKKIYLVKFRNLDRRKSVMRRGC